ncbi:MAG TPA: hypothetical protein PK363_11915, partial [Giesbergeria sp.]|nr:hypothetical protein [Giesbergeria sp.]
AELVQAEAIAMPDAVATGASVTFWMGAAVHAARASVMLSRVIFVIWRITRPPKEICIVLNSYKNPGEFLTRCKDSTVAC